MNITIKDVARKANVSIATVSRVLNNRGIVEEETKKRVQEAVRELSYLPNNLGRSLSIKRTEAIGLILPDLFGEFFSEVIRGVDQTAQQNNCHLLVSSSHSNREEIKAAIQMMRGRVDGLIIMSPHIDAVTLNQNLPKSLPIVLMNCIVDGDSFDSLNINNFDASFAITKHLIDHQHKHIAIIRGTQNNFDADERFRGCQMAIQKYLSNELIFLEIPGNFTEESGYEAVKTILQFSPRPTAIFASNDSIAIGALSALQDYSISVPNEMALVGFDDIPIAKYLSPSLTTVQVDIYSLGSLAIEQLFHAIKEKNEHQKQSSILPYRLMLRESCGCKHPGI
ncbi:MAG: LacI family transcriptional regulator [Bacteroidetes bacterium]|nr:LacI family transcriptional regulator [Bacteroidota bacterium]